MNPEDCKTPLEWLDNLHDGGEYEGYGAPTHSTIAALMWDWERSRPMANRIINIRRSCQLAFWQQCLVWLIGASVGTVIAYFTFGSK